MPFNHPIFKLLVHRRHICLCLFNVTYGTPIIFCRDGGYETSPLIGKFCANQGPPILVSHSNRLWVRFRSDATVTRLGFTAHWDAAQTGDFPLLAKLSRAIKEHI